MEEKIWEQDLVSFLFQYAFLSPSTHFLAFSSFKHVFVSLPCLMCRIDTIFNGVSVPSCTVYRHLFLPSNIHLPEQKLESLDSDLFYLEQIKGKWSDREETEADFEILSHKSI